MKPNFTLFLEYFIAFLLLLCIEFEVAAATRYKTFCVAAVSSNSSPYGDLSTSVCLRMMSFIDFAALIFQSDAFVDPVIRINGQVCEVVMHGD